MATDFSNKVFNDFFNVTITYRADADAVRSYGSFLPKNGAETDTKFAPKSLKNRPKDIGKPAFERKYCEMVLIFFLNFTAWIVSHCKTDSRREDYVKTLRKVTKLTVDQFGKCNKRFVANGYVTSKAPVLIRTLKLSTSVRSQYLDFQPPSIGGGTVPLSFRALLAFRQTSWASQRPTRPT